MMADQTLEIDVGVLLHGFCGADQLVHRLVEQGSQDLILAGEVSVDRWTCKSCTSTQLVDTRTVESLLVEQFRSDIENLTAPVHIVSLARRVNDRYTQQTPPTVLHRPEQQERRRRQTEKISCAATESLHKAPVRRPMTSILPTYDQVVRLPREFGPLIVPPEFEDANGHMNIRHYLDLGAEAIDIAFRRIGFTDEYRAIRRQGFFTAEHHLKYYAEVHVGHRVSAYFRIVERSDKIIHGMTFLVDDTTETLANTLEVIAPHVDLTTRRVAPFASDIADAVDREIATTDQADWSIPVCGVMGIRARHDRAGR